MGAALSTAERARLVGILGRLGSDHDGERVAAAVAASRMLHNLGLGWDAVILPAGGGEVPPSVSAPPSRPRWREDLALCQRHVAKATAWEQNFILSLHSRRSSVSPGQAAKLRQIADTLREQGLQ